MKGRVLFVLLLHVALASTLSGCRTADVAGGQAAHRAALQALSSRSCKIILEEVYTPSDRPEKTSCPTSYRQLFDNKGRQDAGLSNS